MKKKVVLSIIIVSYNTKKLTVQCIDSIAKFPPKFSYEVIVVDNNSTDGTQELLKKKRLVLLENDQNLGFAKANNQGIKVSNGEYILLLNSDTKIINNVLTELVQFAKEHPDAGVVAPKLLNADMSVQPSLFKTPTIARAIYQYWLNVGKVLDKYAVEGNKPVTVEEVVAAAFLITPQARKKAGLLDEKYFMYFEDLDYCRKVRDAGLFVYYVPISSLIHIHGASPKGGTNKLLIESSKKYFGIVRYYIYTFILWSGQKLQRIFS